MGSWYSIIITLKIMSCQFLFLFLYWLISYSSCLRHCVLFLVTSRSLALPLCRPLYSHRFYNPTIYLLAFLTWRGISVLFVNYSKSKCHFQSSVPSLKHRKSKWERKRRKVRALQHELQAFCTNKGTKKSTFLQAESLGTGLTTMCVCSM